MSESVEQPSMPAPAGALDTGPATAGSAENGEGPGAPLLHLPDAPTTLVRLRGLPWSIAGNSLNSVFAQFTVFGSVFVLFLNELGLSKSQIGGLLALLPFTSVLAVFVAPVVARFGYKRTFLSAYGLRTIVTGFLLLTPWVEATFGADGALRFVTIVVLSFAILRALMEIGLIPWVQEFVPNAVRGKYAAKDNLFATLAGMFAIGAAGVTIGRADGLTGYMVLIGAGVLVAFAALWCFSFIPGGAPVRAGSGSSSPYRDMRRALGDGDYRRYLVGVSLVTLGAAALGSFLPLYLHESVGIQTGRVIWVQFGTQIGALISSYVWGWAADRYGSKPVMRTGASVLSATALLWCLIPKHAPYSLYFALGIAMLQGIAGLGWVIGAGRMLHVTIVPPASKAGYLALYTAWLGVVSGASQLAGGRILDATAGLDIAAGPFVLDSYIFLFLIGGALTLAAQPFLSRIRGEDSVGMREFAGLFLRGNPFMAMTSLIRSQLAMDERTTVLRTEQLARAGSRLTVEELVDALSDPRYNVRYEAQIAISRMRRDDRLTQALVAMLEGTELSLSAQAAWALGRMGDPQAIEPLRKSAENPYRSVRMQSVRALGWLNDTESIPSLLERLRNESDRGMQMAYASALGNLRAAEATADILSLMEATPNPGARLELALALARLVGSEHFFVRLLRHMRLDPGTTAAQTLGNLNRRIRRKRRKQPLPAAMSDFADSIDVFAAGDLNQGAKLLAKILSDMPKDTLSAENKLILNTCGDGLAKYAAQRDEYLLLALHTLNVAYGG